MNRRRECRFPQYGEACVRPQFAYANAVFPYTARCGCEYYKCNQLLSENLGGPGFIAERSDATSVGRQ